MAAPSLSEEIERHTRRLTGGELEEYLRQVVRALRDSYGHSEQQIQQTVRVFLMPDEPTDRHAVVGVDDGEQLSMYVRSEGADVSDIPWIGEAGRCDWTFICQTGRPVLYVKKDES